MQTLDIVRITGTTYEIYPSIYQQLAVLVRGDDDKGWIAQVIGNPRGFIAWVQPDEMEKIDSVTDIINRT